MCGRKISEVKFDEAGYQSIESGCYMFDKDKWKSVYALCTQPNDFRSVILYIYRNYKHRLKKKEMLSLTSDTFYGIESGFELRKKSNTLSVITSRRVLTLAFVTVEHFTMWECWLDATFSKGAHFFGQLIKAPFDSTAYSAINREICIYIHDFGFAIATGRPLYLIGNWTISEIKSITFFGDQFHFTPEQPKVVNCRRIQKTESEDGYGYNNGNYASICESEDSVYQIVCWQMQRLKEAFNAAKAGRLRALLSKASESGHWLNNTDKAPIGDSRLHRSKADSVIEHFNKRYETTYYNDIDLLMPKSKRQEQKSEKESVDVLQGILKPYDLAKRLEPTIRESSVDESDTVQADVNGYVNVKSPLVPRKISSNSTTDCHMHPPLSAVGSIASRALTTSEQSFQHFNDIISALQSCRASATSLPALSGRPTLIRVGSWPKSEYEIFREMAATATNSFTCLRAGRSHNEFFSQVETASPIWRNSGAVKEVKGKYVKQPFRSSKAGIRGTRSFRDKKCFRRFHQRSMSVATEPETVKRSSSTREENWDRAKRIIGRTRKSSERSTTTLQSRSLDRLATLPSNSHSNKTSREALERDGERVSRLDLSVNVDNNGLAGTPSVEQKASPIPGLVKLPREKFNLKKESYSFAKNLRRLITGSYSKYDGERATHSYNPQSKNDDSQPHGLEAAIDKGRARFIEAQRRRFGLQASSDSFCRNESKMQHSLVSIAETSKQNMDSNAPYRIRRRSTLSDQTEEASDFQQGVYPNLPSTSVSDIKVVPPPIPERTYKKRLKTGQKRVECQNSAVSTCPDNSKKSPAVETGTSYMMVNEAADQFLGKLNEAESASPCTLPLATEKSRRRTFGLPFHMKNFYNDSVPLRQSKGSIIKRVFL